MKCRSRTSRICSNVGDHSVFLQLYLLAPAQTRHHQRKCVNVSAVRMLAKCNMFMAKLFTCKRATQTCSGRAVHVQNVRTIYTCSVFAFIRNLFSVREIATERRQTLCGNVSPCARHRNAKCDTRTQRRRSARQRHETDRPGRRTTHTALHFVMLHARACTERSTP